ncbi:cobalamin biosynthesis protein CbiD [Peptacetobacter hominis]|uniref:Cobalt-precorrin-5B C(1)-methyltransferase n=1 Tax=Peptacetobacter hominis TaxID=2743610 RepID=A0A544QT39_9FIRM|nr:cobalt-precorrin-5B (C(1))-methyltransferase CbiD [Peptacetobacter hominis]TQQ83206.1 cobalamin biosynthesis protein CbiD [Peptacetobacter hominis]
MEDFVYVYGKKYRRGYTTGSCATAASKAAVYMLLSQKKTDSINIDTPKGIPLSIDIHDISISENRVSCSVIKDGGDDIDATNGMKIYADAEFVEKESPGKIVEKSKTADKDRIIDENNNRITYKETFSFEGEGFAVFSGEGIGIITRKGLSHEPGYPAINPVPQKMISKEVSSILSANERFIKITLSAPEGKKIAEKTFNPRLGIEGGISIIGTTGIVEPMSDEGWKKSLSLELNMKRELGMDSIIMVPGNHGEAFIRENTGKELSCVVRTSNFIGYMLMEAKRMGFKNILLAGHIGKFVKLSAGIFNTHSRNADARSEILVSNLALEGADIEILKKVDSCLTAEEAVAIIKEYGYDRVFDNIAEKCRKRAMQYTDGEINIGVFVFDMEKNILGKSSNAEDMLKEIADA